jgi:hypothetical protein
MMEYQPTGKMVWFGEDTIEAARILRWVRGGRTTPESIADITGESVEELRSKMDQLCFDGEKNTLCRRKVLWKGIRV